ncbi:MAG TPA: hypothetical protein VIY48_15975 [Candidatus Paceibacterota bacterium]
MTALTPVTIKGPFDAISANGADFTFTQGSTDGDTFACTGRQVLLVRNTHATDAQTVTIDSVDDEQNRQNDITTYSLAAGEFAVFGIGLTNEQGWKTAAGIINLDCSSTDIYYAVLTLPARYP